MCEREYEKDYFAHIEKASHHACSRSCQGRAQHVGGSLDVKKRQVMIERYGVDNPQRVEAFKEKSRQTNLERYGCEVGSQSDEVKERARQTNRERFNVDWHTQSENFADKARKTWEKRYGVDHPMRSDVVKAKYDFTALWWKAHETKKRNGTYASSRVEQRLHERLCRMFPNVQAQVRIEHSDGTWLIDFQIGETYLQFDGVYWHGLDRPINVIRASAKPRDQAILFHYERDRQQDAWFVSQNMKLVRITDRQAKTMSDNQLRSLLTS